MLKHFKDLPVSTQQVKNGADRFYRMAMNHPKTSAAVLLGTGAAALIVWLSRRNGGFRPLHQEILARVRGIKHRSGGDLPA